MTTARSLRLTMIGFILLSGMARSVIAEGAGNQKRQEMERRLRERESAEKDQIDQRRRDEDAKLEEALSSAARQRWTALPNLIRRTYVDPSGRAWFEANSIADAERELKASVEEAFAGKTRVIRGTIFLIDRQNRFWVTTQRLNHLFCYDGRKWISRDAVAPVESPNSKEFLPAGWQDSAGNVYFLSGSESLGWSVQCLPAGSGAAWDVRPVVGAAAANHGDGFRTMAVSLFEQAGHRLILCTLSGHTGPAEQIVVPYFDGQNWSLVHPRVCQDKDHSIGDVIPLPDGSIATRCDGGHIWVYWPEITRPDTSKVGELIDKLSDPDPNARDRAASSLVAIGPQAIDTIKKIPQADLPPEARARVRIILESIQASLIGDHAKAQLYGGRFAFRNAYFAGRSSIGRVWLYADSCTDVRTGSAYAQALLSIEPDGTWKLHPAPLDQWQQNGLTRIPQGVFEDSHGRLWLESTLRTKPDFTAERVDAPGITPGDVLAESRDGQFFFDRHPTFVFHEASADAQPDLSEQVIRAIGAVVVNREQSAFAVPNDIPTNGLFLLDGRGATSIPAAWEKPVGVRNLMPLRNGNVIVRLDKSPNMPGPTAAFYDGANWHTALTLQDLVEACADALTKVSGRSFVDGQHAALAADDQGHLWFHEEGYRLSRPEGQVPFNTFRFYDGVAWHDVWAELTAQDARYGVGTIHHAVNHGRSVLVECRSAHAVLLVSFDQASGKVHADVLYQQSEHPQIGSFLDVASSIDAPNGDFWFWSPQIGNVFRLFGGKLQSFPNVGIPLLADSKGNVFFAGSNKLQVRTGDGSASITIDGLDTSSQAAAMTESPDGRLWLLHTKGLSQIVLTPSLREVARYSWGTPRNHFSSVFCDDANGLWFAADNIRLIRVSLPK